MPLTLVRTSSLSLKAAGHCWGVLIRQVNELPGLEAESPDRSHFGTQGRVSSDLDRSAAIGR